MTEKLPYELIESRDGFELRHYPRHVVAEVNIRGDFMQAGSAAFGPLVSYISGRNEGSQKIAMTAPVLQTSTDASTHVVSFVMPSDMKPGDVPNPTGGVVNTRVVEPTNMAAIRFGGGWNRLARYAAMPDQGWQANLGACPCFTRAGWQGGDQPSPLHPRKPNLATRG